VVVAFVRPDGPETVSLVYHGVILLALLWPTVITRSIPKSHRTTEDKWTDKQTF